MQKLRKKGGLQPRDAVEVVYDVRCEGGEGGEGLRRIIQQHLEYIESTTKGPLRPLTPDVALGKTLVEDEQKVK